MFIEFKFPNAGGPQNPPNPQDPFIGVDVIDDATTVRLKIDVPGMKMGDIRVELHEGLLLINCKRNIDLAGMRHHGRCDVNFSKTFTLDETLDNDRMEASCADGVLEVVLWKKVPAL